ncbi:MAG TPA: RNA 2',3'-cyclic phosphodiesterase [Candidatus Nanoarchaeia archaeon]|nr:RNA 2',3'-cyclic phosphodiesterase [Candidatus Nanoarchaeia archaeon]
MRLFIGFDASSEAKEEIIQAQKSLKDSKLNLAKDFHLTLKFLGEVKESKVDEIGKKLEDVGFESFEAELDSIGVFPGEDYIKVVWVGLEPKYEITQLQKSIENALEGLFPKDDRFHPHITIARVKFINDKKQFKDDLKAIQIRRVKFMVDRFKLIKSVLGPQGPLYEVIKELKARNI